MATMYHGQQAQPHGWASLEERYEVMKEIGDGSFGSVALARVRTAGASVARRGTLVAIKTMKKTFESFSACLELREVIFLRSLPPHPHLVPALDIFLDPYSRRLHITMEYMDGNLYQLMKARDHKPMDAHSVKSILFQIMSGLEHIHDRDFFHRDIKPENILVSTSQQNDTSHPFRRYSALMTPPSTPPVYTIKIADFGLARETHSKLPYTTYVSTRWYRAPEVLLRAGEYSAPVDIWAVGAMAVEIATLKPLFPGGNEVDQVWRVCEIMGSPGGWVNKHGQRVGGGEWKDGVRLAQKLGFSFPKMAPHSLETILQVPQWPASLAHFVTWCLMWDPRNRPTSSQALAHEFFHDAFDPVRLKSSSRLLGRKQSDLSAKDSPDASPSLTSKTSSWLRRSLVARESAPAVPQHTAAQQASPRPSPANSQSTDANPSNKNRPAATKRATWTNGVPSNGAPIPILPSIRPVSPLSAEVTAQASVRPADGEEKAARKIGRQLSVASHGNHYADIHRQEAERALNGQSGLSSPTSGHREGFFSHLRKRARRLSGRYQTPMSPNSDDIEANAGCAPWGAGSNRQSMVIDPPLAQAQPSNTDLSDLDKALKNVRCSLEGAAQPSNATKSARVAANPMLKRHHSLNYGSDQRSDVTAAQPHGPVSSRTRRAMQNKSNPSNRYETPNEEEELLSEVLASTHKAVKKMDKHSQTPAEQQRKAVRQSQTDLNAAASYLTPSPSANRNGVGFGQNNFATPTKPLEISKMRTTKDEGPSKWPTPPYDESDWASSVSASLMATQSMYR